MIQQWYCGICDITESTSQHCTMIYHRHDTVLTILQAVNRPVVQQSDKVKVTVKSLPRKRRVSKSDTKAIKL